MQVYCNSGDKLTNILWKIIFKFFSNQQNFTRKRILFLKPDTDAAAAGTAAAPARTPGAHEVLRMRAAKAAAAPT